MNKAIILGIGAVVSITILIVTGSVAFYSRTANCDSCHEMKKDYDSWKISSHSSVPCRSCHQRTAGSLSIQGTALARIVAHFFKADKNPQAYVSKESCLQCHSAIKKSIKPSPDSHVVNPHPIHLAAGFVCAHCHKRVVHVSDVSSPNRPQMRDCINCHRAKDVSTACETCHYSTQDHIAKIAQAGGYTLKDGESCEVCHTEKDVDKTDHRKALQNVGGYIGSETCLRCHVYAAKQIGGAVHGMLKTKVADVPGLNVPMGMASRAANPILWAYLIPRKDGTFESRGCGQCHIGGSNLPTPETASQVDCLICHAEKYDFKKRHVEKVGNVVKWVYDQTPEVAATVGKPKAEYCWRCHEDHMAGNRGTPYTPDNDAHARAGIACQSCHVAIDHKIAKGSVADMMANDIPELAVTCTSCHVDYKHDNKSIDIHLNRLACQTCHVGKVEGAVVWDHTKGIDLNHDGLLEDSKIMKKNINPTFFWFNGTATNKGVPVGSRSDKEAMIYPFKILKNISAINSDTGQPVGGSPVVMAQTGDFSAAVKALAQSMGLPEAPKWVPVESPKIEQLDHGIKEEGLECNDCHAKKGIMDFKALGYTSEEINELTKPQDD